MVAGLLGNQDQSAAQPEIADVVIEPTSLRQPACFLLLPAKCASAVRGPSLG